MKYVLSVFIVLFLINFPLHSQGTQEDYLRSNQHRQKYQQKLLRSKVDIHWAKNEKSLWYTVNIAPRKKETFFVNFETGKKKKAFDSAKLSQALKKLTGKNYSTTKLPFKIHFNDTGSFLYFNLKKTRYQCDLSSYTISKNKQQNEVQKQDSPKPSVTKKRKSRSGRSVDGKWQAFIKAHNLFLKDLKTKEEFQLTKNGSETDSYKQIYFSPDSSKIICIQTTKVKHRKVHMVETTPKEQLQPKLHTLNYRKPGDALPQQRPRLFDVSTKKNILINETLFKDSWQNNRWQWSKNGKEFTFLHNQRGHQALRLISINAVDGKAKAIIDERSKTFIHYSGKNYLQQLADTNEIIWMSERDGWNHLYLIDARNGQIKNQITKGLWPVKHVEYVDTKKRQIWFTATGVHPYQDPYHIHYCRINFDGSGFTMLTQGDGTHSLKYSPSEKYYIDTYSRVDLPPINELRRTEDGQLICTLEKADDRLLLSSGWKAPVRFKTAGRDGKTDIWGILIFPTNFDKTKKYPIVEQIYAGPHGSHVPKSFHQSSRAMNMAELGFITVQIDGMGTSNRSKAFHDTCWQNLSDSGFPDRIIWMKEATKIYPQMNLNKVGIYGGSAGGQSALSALLHFGHFYKVAAADCGCHDNRLDKIWWNEQWMGKVGPHYQEQANLTHAHKLKGKLLLTVG